MSEGSLVNRYLQYKAGTAKVVTWLAQTARKSRDVTDILPSLKAANNAAKHAKRNKRAPREDTNVKVTTNQLLNLAQVIVDAGLRVPEEILRTIRVVIEGREHCADWHMSMHSDAEQNGGHQYFIKIMKDILRMFGHAKQPAATAGACSKSSKSTAGSAPNASNGLGNMFELLQIDEPSSNALGSAPAQAKNAVTFELEVTHDEKSFAIWCLLQDLCELRHELKSLWLDYKNGRISFDNASMLTSFGIGFIYYAQQEFTIQHPDLDSYPSIIEHVGLQVAHTHDEVFICPQDIRKPPKISKGRLSADEIAQLFCPRASLVLKGFIEVLSRKIRKFHKPVQKGFYFQAMSRKESASRATGDPLLTMLHTLADYPQIRPPIWIVQALHIHMDIHDILGPNVEHEMFQFQKSLAANLECMQALHVVIDERLTGGLRYTLLKDCVEMEESYTQLAKDPYSRTELKGTKLMPLTKEVYPMYQAFPAIPGQIVNTVAMSVHNRGITCCDVDRIVLSAAYLYRTAIKVGAITKPWADMEFLIGIQSRWRPYVLETESSDDLTSIARGFGVSLGMKPSAYRRGQRPKLLKPTVIERDARRMAVDCPLVTVVKVKEGDDVTVPDNKTTLVQAGIQSLEQLQKSGRASERLVEVYQQYRKTGKLTPTHLLLAMKEAFVADEMELNFNYIGFFDTCLTMLGDILTQWEPFMPVQTTYDPVIKKMYVPAYVCVYTILWDAVDRSASNSSLQQSMLFRAGATMEKVIEKKGGECVKLAQEKMVNLRQPAAARGDEADSSEKRNKANDIDLIRKFFGTSSKETRGPGMFCSCTSEVEARVNLRRLQQTAKYYPGKVSQKELVDAACKVLAFALPGIPDGEREDAVDRLSRALKTHMGEAVSHLEPKDMLAMFVKRGLHQIVNGGDASSKDGTDGKENARP